LQIQVWKSTRGYFAVIPLKLKDWVLLAGIAACSFVWFAVGSALRGLLA